MLAGSTTSCDVLGFAIAMPNPPPIGLLTQNAWLYLGWFIAYIFEVPVIYVLDVIGNIFVGIGCFVGFGFWGLANGFVQSVANSVPAFAAFGIFGPALAAIFIIVIPATILAAWAFYIYKKGSQSIEKATIEDIEMAEGEQPEVAEPIEIKGGSRPAPAMESSLPLPSNAEEIPAIGA